MLKLCPRKRPVSDAKPTKPMYYHGVRPSGSAPFDTMHDILNWSFDQEIKAKIYAAYPKIDGFQVVIDQTGSRVVLRTKRGFDYGRSSGKLKELDLLIRQRFACVIHKSVTHPTAGAAVRFYAEVCCDTGDGDDLSALMHGRPNPTHLRVFDCDFAKSSIRIPLPDKLKLLRKLMGEEHVIPTLFDARGFVTRAQIEALEECMAKTEGIVVESKGRKFKHKASLPLPLHLLGVGFTQIDSVSVPSHFVWGIPTTPGHFAVVLIDNRSYLCDSTREDDGKMYIDPREFVGLTCKNDTIIGQNYDALLAMLVHNPLVDAVHCSTREVRVISGNVYTINKNRSFAFDSAAFKFLSVPVLGVVGGNSLWLTGDGKSPGSVHIQAPQFLASKDYGHPIFRMLIPGYVDPEYPDTPEIPSLTDSNLVLLASIVRNVHAHAEIVYGPSVKVDLVYGVRIEASPYNTPQHSDDDE